MASLVAHKWIVSMLNIIYAQNCSHTHTHAHRHVPVASVGTGCGNTIHPPYTLNFNSPHSQHSSVNPFCQYILVGRIIIFYSTCYRWYVYILGVGNVKIRTIPDINLLTFRTSPTLIWFTSPHHFFTTGGRGTLQPSLTYF